MRSSRKFWLITTFKLYLFHAEAVANGRCFVSPMMTHRTSAVSVVYVLLVSR